jgi:hypothetical protein
MYTNLEFIKHTHGSQYAMAWILDSPNIHIPPKGMVVEDEDFGR